MYIIICSGCTFLNCMRTLSIPRKPPPLDIETRVDDRAIKSSYKNRCRFDKVHIITCSYFPGNCFSTSFFNLRSTKGRMTPCKRATRASLTLFSPSTIEFNGELNQYPNSFRLLKTWGIKKCIKAHNSIKLF